MSQIFAYLGLCFLLALSSIGLAINFSSSMSSTARNPSKTKEIQILCLLGAAFIELLVFIGTLSYFMIK